MNHVKTLGVVGAGPTGAGIAQVGLTSGLSVTLFDLNASALDQARTDIMARIARMVEKGQLDGGLRRNAASGCTSLRPSRILPRPIW